MTRADGWAGGGKAGTRWAQYLDLVCQAGASGRRVSGGELVDPPAEPGDS